MPEMFGGKYILLLWLEHMDKQLLSQEEGQLTYEESTGVKVTPESLYEAQLQNRLGYVPAWLKALK